MNCLSPTNIRNAPYSAAILKANATPHVTTGLIIRSSFLLLRIEAVTAARENLFMHTPCYGI